MTTLKNKANLCHFKLIQIQIHLYFIEYNIVVNIRFIPLTHYLWLFF